MAIPVYKTHTNMDLPQSPVVVIYLCMVGPLKAELVHEKRGGLQLCNGIGSARKT